MHVAHSVWWSLGNRGGHATTDTKGALALTHFLPRLFYTEVYTLHTLPHTKLDTNRGKPRQR